MTEQRGSQALIERVLAATGPDRRLDAMIGAVVRAGPINGTPDWLANWVGEYGPMPKIVGSIAAMHSNGEPGVHWESRAYTRSVDDAITLKPEGCFYGFLMDGDGDGFIACCQHAGPDQDPPELLWTKAATPALALTAACLKALSIKDVGL